MVDGILNINKPAGRTSFSLVAMVKRLSGEPRVGHAGTLDPEATGVLPICLGQGTRVVEFLVDATKSYRAEVELGVATDTYDGAGQIIQRGDYSAISYEEVTTALASFRGQIQQTPPMYSAVKYRGQPLYKLARAGVTVERKSRPARIYDLELIEWQPPQLAIEVVCGKGTYIRSLAHDLGQALGCGAYLKTLVRLRCGVFDIGDAVSVPQLEDAFRYGYWQRFLYPIDTVLGHWSAMVVSDDAGQDLRLGRPLALENGDGGEEGIHLTPLPSSVTSSADCCRAYALDGRFLGVLRFNAVRRQWQPEKVFF